MEWLKNIANKSIKCEAAFIDICFIFIFIFLPE